MQEELKEEVYYNTRTWLNDLTSASTSSVVCFDGIREDETGFYRSMYLEISDCKGKIKLHQSYNETNEQFIDKLKLLNSEIENFVKHLENNK